MLRAAFLPMLAAGALHAADIAVTQTGRGFRYETPRAVVELDPGPLGHERRLELVRLIDRGIQALEPLLEGRPSAGASNGKLHYAIRHRTAISTAYGSYIALPYERVLSHSAPYLHETAHALLDGPGPDPPMWLSEGLASYLESYVAENHGGYQAHVFSRGGNAGIDADALRHLQTAFGRDAFDAVATSRVPRNIRRDRQNVARPFYVLSQSFVKFLVAGAGLDRVIALHRQPASRLHGRALLQWKADWRRFLESRFR